MSKNATETTYKTFTVTEDGRTVTYKRTEKGYCTRDGRRISAKAFAEAEDLRDGELLDQIEDDLAWVDETIAKVRAAETADPDPDPEPRTLTPDEMEELYGLRSEKAWSWYELARRYGVTERAVREAFDFVRKLDDEAAEVTVGAADPVGNTEETFEAEPVPDRPEFDIPGVRKDQASVGYVDGHEYVHDWFGRRYFRDGEEISKFEYDHEVHGDAEPRRVTKGAAKRVRRPKDVAGTYETSEGTVTLTAKQLDFMRELGKLSEDDLLGSVRGGVWCDVLCDQIGGQFAGRPMSVGAMISTVCEKGLGERSKERREDGAGTGRGKTVTVFRLTKKGEEVWEDMGL